MVSFGDYLGSAYTAEALSCVRGLVAADGVWAARAPVPPVSFPNFTLKRGRRSTKGSCAGIAASRLWEALLPMWRGSYYSLGSAGPEVETLERRKERAAQTVTIRFVAAGCLNR